MMTMIRPSSPMRKKATRTSPTLSATSAATKRLEIDPELCSGFCNRGVAQGAPDKLRGHSSAGRALAWHARGRRFDPAWLHHASPFGLRVAQPRDARRTKRGARRSPLGRRRAAGDFLSSGYAWHSYVMPEGRSVVPGVAHL